ncbi:MAG: HEAT repeat domain-containing protein, partial [Clostridia bacterium]|nr:HEAT repeat domain-containing protein [Clostridia bacterium]
KDGKYKGANCESWTVNPKSAFACSSLIKARIPVERVIGCYASDHKLYCCNEKELTICTSGLDFEFKDLLDGTDRSTDAALKVRDQEQSNAEKRIKGNLTKMMGDEAKNLDFSRPGYERLPEESRKKLFDYIKSQMTSDDAAAVDRNTPQDILDLLAESENYEVRQKVAANESTSKDTMMKLAQDPDKWVRIKLSANQAAPAEALTSLMGGNDSWTYDLGPMRMNIAHHPNATPEILSLLAEDKDSEVRRLTAANPNLATEDQLKLAKDERMGVRLVLARNPSATKEALEIIASEKYPSMAQEEAAKRLKKMNSSQPDMETPVTQEEKKQLEDYLSGKGIDRKAAAKDGQTPPEILGLLIRDNPEGIMHDLAENKNSPEWVLNGLANSEYKSVRMKVALNPSASENTMLKLARDEDDVVQRTLLGNPSITLKVREALADSEDTFLRYYQANSFSTPPEILDKLCKDKDKSVRSAVANNKNTSEETLKKMLEDDPSQDIRKQVQERLDQLEKQKPKKEPPKPEPPKEEPKKEETKPQEKKPEEQPADSGNSYGLGTLKLFMKHGNAQTKKFAENEFKKQMQQREDDCINQLDGDKEAYEQLKDYKKSIGGKKGHGRTPEQVKQDFVKNMDPSKYGSPELFQKAKERIQKMPVGKFEALMAAIYDDDVEMFDQMKEGI